jgi:hypothetical protein
LNAKKVAVDETLTLNKATIKKLSASIISTGKPLRDRLHRHQADHKGCLRPGQEDRKQEDYPGSLHHP